MAEEKGKQVPTGYVDVEFTKSHGSKKVGDVETYHKSTANALVSKIKVGKIIKTHKVYEPKKVVKE